MHHSKLQQIPIHDVTSSKQNQQTSEKKNSLASPPMNTLKFSLHYQIT